MNTFSDCFSFEGKGLEKWNIKKCQSLYHTFQNCHNFNCDISDWDVSNIKYFGSCFEDCKNFEYDLSKWNVNANIENMRDMFTGCKKLIKNKKLPDWWPYRNILYLS